jgi:ubiquinone/menaquinone biosynthesis C-methylase UbiE
LKEITRVLKPGGKFLSLEGAMSKTFAQDPKIMEIYSKVLPDTKDGGPAI